MSESGKSRGGSEPRSEPAPAGTVRQSVPFALAIVAILYSHTISPVSRFFGRLWAPVGRWVKRHHLIVVWTIRRAINAVAQILGILTILYYFFDVLAASASTNETPLSVITGWWTFVTNILTGQWGTISIAGVVAIPTATYIGYYLPYSIELAALALAISLLVAYPVGLYSGWHRGRVLDSSVRGYTAVWLFFPAIIFSLIVILFLYQPFLTYSGDNINAIFGTLPSIGWFSLHGGYPSWIDPTYDFTSPTGFPLIDAAWHGAWSMEWIIFLKVMIEALCIAVSYVALFLRYARNATVEATKAEYLRAGRARGIPNRQLLWRHAGRRVIPLYIFTIGNTFGMFIIIQSTVELIFNTQGALYLLLFAGGQSLIGGGIQTQQALLIVLIFLISVVILVVSIVAEIVAMALDPAWLSEKEKGGT
jgi:peptide/nickel transport system permease protein